MSTYTASTKVSVEPFLAWGENSPFADRSASFDLHVDVDEAGIDASAHAIVAALHEAAAQAERAIARWAVD